MIVMTITKKMIFADTLRGRLVLWVRRLISGLNKYEISAEIISGVKISRICHAIKNGMATIVSRNMFLTG
jgi:hypothetical protein